MSALLRTVALASRYSRNGRPAAPVVGIHAGTFLASASALLMTVAVSRQNATR